MKSIYQILEGAIDKKEIRDICKTVHYTTKKSYLTNGRFLVVAPANPEKEVVETPVAISQILQKFPTTSYGEIEIATKTLQDNLKVSTKEDIYKILHGSITVENLKLVTSLAVAHKQKSVKFVLLFGENSDPKFVWMVCKVTFGDITFYSQSPRKEANKKIIENIEIPVKEKKGEDEKFLDIANKLIDKDSFVGYRRFLMNYGQYQVATDEKALLKFSDILTSATIEKNAESIKDSEGLQKVNGSKLPDIERFLKQVEYPEDGSKFVIDIAKLEELIAKLPKKNKTRIEDKANILFYSGKDYTAINHKYLKMVCALAKFFKMDKVSIVSKISPMDLIEFDFGGNCKFYTMPMRMDKAKNFEIFEGVETVEENNLVYHS